MNSAKTVAAPPQKSRGYTRLHWGVTALLFFSTVINYMDRQNLSILARTIQDDLRISDLQYSYVVQLFLLAYTLSYVVAGRVTDWLGTRASMAVFIVWWSLADICTSLSRSIYSLGFFRFLLGVGEPGNYTAAPKAVSEWFAAKDRALIIGIYTAGATLGATIAPPLIAHLAAHFHWRMVFIFTGSLGLLWVVPWLLIYRKPSAAERPQDEPERDLPAETSGSPWRAVLLRRETWLLTLGRLITDPVWYFYLFWFPKYLTDSRHLTLIEVGRIAWIVYLAADIGCIAGGYLSGRLIRRGLTPAASRLRVMAIAAIVLPLSPLVPHIPNPLFAVLLASTAAFAHLSWQISLSAMVVDLYPKRLVGTVFGIVAAGSGLGGMISTNIVGHLVTSWSYVPVFAAMGFLHPLAFLMLRTLKSKTATTA